MLVPPPHVILTHQYVVICYFRYHTVTARMERQTDRQYVSTQQSIMLDQASSVCQASQTSIHRTMMTTNNQVKKLQYVEMEGQAVQMDLALKAAKVGRM
jgi:hypothetical protein